MTNLTQYKYRVTENFYDYLIGKITLEVLITKLRNIELIERVSGNYDDEANMLFRIPSDSTMLTTISEIEHDLSLPLTHPNHAYMRKCMELSVGLYNEVAIYFS